MDFRIDMIMRFSLLILSTISLKIAVTYSDSGTYNYDRQDLWKDITYPAPITNDCAKLSNSPIDIPASIASTCQPNTNRIVLSVSDSLWIH